MQRYYITDPASEKGFVEVTEAEFTALVGDETTRPYASQVYRGTLAIEDVPQSLQADVQAVVDVRTARWGEYRAQEVPADELKTMIEEVL